MERLLIATVTLTVMVVAFPSSKIIGGREAADGAYPYLASLKAFGSHFCGGSILNENWILTSAHCLRGLQPFLLWVSVGTNNASNGDQSYRCQLTISHPNYTTNNNDIGLIKLETPLKMGPKVAPVEITRDEIKVGQTLILAGWGTTHYPNIRYPQRLQEIELKTISNKECAETQMEFPIMPDNVCTVSNEDVGICVGDYGGPLVDKTSKKMVGLVSWGTPCATGAPDVHTRILRYLDWIDEQLKNNN